ncbi:putative bifunctional diguanylate cyclase/phosphodiesterase [Solimicrobium silvestre]|uniref:GGDEF: diguanylate cyclase (GGDEF) domain n=1 Tax=Solimicrobium silvestre TaxID=2099400 RepID=A0A2S9GWY8_9BURK|nr:EAL domain-containing protein [Solimicrobium silvestre]PRC92237.1 GGDEF: diguanylate cyclase (GGDEF) domain [Solimicrobium silvestre]
MPPNTKPSKTIINAGLALRPHRLIQIVSIVLIAISISILLNLLEGNWTTVCILLGISGVLSLAVWQAKSNHIDRAAKIVVATLACSMCFLSFKFEGIHDAAICALPAIMIFAAMFSTRRLFITTLIFIFVILTLMVTANIQGWYINEVKPVTWNSLIDVLAILSATACFVWLLASDLRVALAHLETENDRISDAFSRIDTLAHHDALTGLPNRLLARLRFEQAVELARRSQQHIAVLFLDLDNFKTVNDSLGHAAGDALLCDVAQRLKIAARASDTVSRQGGDEFLIVMAGQADHSAVATVSVKIINSLLAPFHVNGMELLVTCSLGIALYPEDGEDFDTLLKHSDMAMYKAKDSGRNALRFYDVEMNTSVIEHLHLISGIRSALLKHEFKLYYQPQYHLKTGRIIGAEALIRWIHPEQGLIPPIRFIPVAERSGQIHEIGTWVINEACRQAKEWQNAGLSQLVVAINLSPIQFRRDDLEGDVMHALATAQLSASSIELELTESLLIAESSQISSLLSRLRLLGIRLSIDDFGTGYSNLGYLSRFEVERLKIDQSFVRRMMDNSNDQGIVRAIIEMAHSLKLEVVAEGVENSATLTRLIELGCEYGQGFHWSPALPAEQFFKFVKDYQILDGE